MRTRYLTIASLALITLVACDDELPTAHTAPQSPVASRAAPSDPTPTTISLTRIGGFDGGGEAAAEITAFDNVSRRLFVVNGALGTVDVLDLRNPAAPHRIATLSVEALGAAANSVATRENVVAVAIEAHEKTAPGTVAFYRASTLQLISTVSVGSLPDMLTFTPDGLSVVVANEAEPNADYSVDPVGSVSIIDVRDINHPVATTAGFEAFDANTLRARGVRIFGPGANAAQDLEPEYVAVSEDSRTAWVTLQENNALALVDLVAAMVVDVLPLGYKDHSLTGHGLDPSDRDGGSKIGPWPLLGMYQPDAIAAYDVAGETFVVTANEGDAREYETFAEESRVRELTLHPSAFPHAICGGSACGADSNLGRLAVTTTLGQGLGGEYDALYAFGARSFSIWTAAGELVWDSGDELEQITAALSPDLFNASNEDPAEVDNRSDNKGPEPEGVVLGRLGEKTFAFIGLERVGGVMVYDVSNPYAPSFITYVNTRATHGDLGPEGLAFVPAIKAPGKQPLLIVGNEISGTTAIFRVELH